MSRPAFAAHVRLIRPLNLVITAAGVLLGAVLSARFTLLDSRAVVDVLTAAASAVFLGAGGYSINDVFDLEVDAVNRPDRPLPSGRVSNPTSRLIWFFTTAVGIAMGALVSVVHLVMAASAAGLLFIYAARLQRIPFVGNLAVAAVVGLAVVYGGWAVGSPIPAGIGAGFAFLTTFAREIIKDVEDVEGDRAFGARTAPVAYGIPYARTAAAAVLILTIVLTPLPFLAMDYGPLYLFIVVVADLYLLRSIWLLADSPGDASDAGIWLKGAMVAGMAALFAA